MKTNRRGFFQAFVAAAAGTLAPTAAQAPAVAVGQTLKTVIHIDGRAIAEMLVRELPRVARLQGLR